MNANRADHSNGRPPIPSKRKPPSRSGLEELEARLLLSSLPLHVVANQLEDSLGRVVVLRGVNVNSLEFRPDGDNVLQAESIALNDWHANLVRVPLNEDYWFGHDEWWTGGESGDGGAAYRALVGNLVSAAQADNDYVMLDLHWSDMGVFGVGNDGQHFLPDNNSTLFWQSAAKIYANNPAVLFDPYNEPSLGVWNPSGGWWDFTPTTAEWKLWHDGGTVIEGDVAHNTGATIGTYSSPGMQGLINTIRAAGATNLIAPEGLNWGSDLTGVTTGYALSDPTGNLMYQSHLYPGKDTTSTVTVGAQHPIYVGEWGDGGVVGQPSAAAAASNTSMLAFLNAHNYSWTAWDLSPEVGADLNLLTSWNAAAATSDYGALVKADLAQHVAAGTSPTFAFTDTDDWGTGFVGYISITNHGTTAISGWTLGFNFAGGIDPTPNTGIWDAQVVSHVGSQFQVQNVSWDAAIPAGESVSFGFVATWDAAHTAPGSFALAPKLAIFYNHSAWDGNDPSANPTDDNAIAADKTPLLPGGTATFANYTSYSRGINGIMVDFAGLVGTVTAGDFTFKVGNSNTPGSWVVAAAPVSVTVRAGAGAGGTDRVTLIWADNAIQNDWLQITVLADAATGLAANDVFYFGNAIGETGNSTTDAVVDAADFSGVRDHPRSFLNRAPVTYAYDINRDGFVDGTDLVLVRDHNTTVLNSLKLIAVPSGGSSAPSEAAIPVSAAAVLEMPIAGVSGGEWKASAFGGGLGSVRAADAISNEAAGGEMTVYLGCPIPAVVAGVPHSRSSAPADLPTMSRLLAPMPASGESTSDGEAAWGFGPGLSEVLASAMPADILDGGGLK
jgi:hypothetical protein